MTFVCRSHAGVFLPHVFRSSDDYTNELCILTHCSISELVVTHFPTLAVSILSGIIEKPSTNKYRECEKLLAKCSKVLQQRDLEVMFNISLPL